MNTENQENIRERILSLIDAEFESDAAFERAMGLADKTVIYLYEWEKVDRLFDMNLDYEQNNNIADSDTDTVDRLCRLMAELLLRHDAPPEQFTRLRLEAYLN